MDKPDMSAIALKMVEAVRTFVSKSEAVIGKRMDAWEAQLAAIPAGPKGDKGDAGESIRGEQGIPGERGESVKGEKGDPGEAGQAGESIRGEAGLPGKDGRDGIDGKDANEDKLFAELRHELAVLVDAIPKALDGSAGTPGKDGASIHPDTVALMVREAVDKAVSALPAAKDGKDGAPGRDAAELVVLPAIDEARSYPAGTYAKYAGGEIRAERRTDPVKNGDILVAGWTVAREGVSALVVTQGDDPRELTVAAMLTSGTKTVASFTVPMVLDKGVWREGEHQEGDHVSWDGSGWIAQKATTDKPGTSDAWRLSTKRGQAGRDWSDPKAKSDAHKPVRLS